MKRRNLLTGAASLLLGISLAACGGGGGTAPDGSASAADPTTTTTTDSSVSAAPEGATGEVTMWMYPVIADEAASQTFWDEQKAAFETANPGVTLNIELRPWANRDEQLATAIAAGEGPDLVYLIPDQLGQYVATGGIVPIGDMVSSFEADIRPTALDAGTVNGELYGLPILQTSTVLAYNKALFDAAGVTELPKTWDEIKAAAPALAEQGTPILAYYGTDTLNLSFYPLLWQAGGSLFTEDGSDVAFNSPEGVEALQFLVDLKDAGGLPADAAIAAHTVESDFIISQQAAMTYTFESSFIADVEAAIGADNLVLGGVLEGKEQVAYGAVGMLSRTSVRDNDAAVQAALEFFGTAEFSEEFVTIGNRLPARSDVTLETDEQSQVFVDALDFVKSGEPNEYARQLQGVLSPHIQAALQGDVTPQEALDAAAEEARSMMG